MGTSTEESLLRLRCLHHYLLRRMQTYPGPTKTTQCATEVALHGYSCIRRRLNLKKRPSMSSPKN